MLVLSRKQGEVIFVGDVEVVVLKVNGSRVSLGFSAPAETQIRRSDIRDSNSPISSDQRLKKSKKSCNKALSCLSNNEELRLLLPLSNNDPAIFDSMISDR